MCEAFSSERLEYREISVVDAEKLVKWRSDPQIIEFFLNPEPITIDTHLDWYYNCYLVNNKRTDYIIVRRDTSESIGTINIIETGDDSASIGYTIGEHDSQKRGYAKESILALINKASLLGIKKLTATIHKDNTASIKTVEALGFSLSNQNGLFVTMECNVPSK